MNTKSPLPLLVIAAALGAAAALNSGCKIMEPTSTCSGSILGAPFKIKTPQNHSLQGLLITAEQATNGGTKVSISINSLSAVTDPNVVQATAAGQAQLLGATAQLVQQSAGATQLLLQQLGASAQQAGLATATGGASLAIPKPAVTVPPAAVQPAINATGPWNAITVPPAAVQPAINATGPWNAITVPPAAVQPAK